MLEKAEQISAGIHVDLRNLKVARGAFVVLLLIFPIVLVTLFLSFFEYIFEQRELRVVLPLVYLVPVIFAATQLGVVPALFSAILCALTADYFFYDPIYSFQISDPQQVFDLFLFMLVAGVLGHVTGHLREQIDSYVRQKSATDQLYSFSQRLLSCNSVDELRSAIEEFFAGQVRRQIQLLDIQVVAGGNAALPSSVTRRIADGHGSRAAGNVEWIEDHSDEIWAISTLVSGDPRLGTVVLGMKKAAGFEIREVKKIVESLLTDVTTILTRLNVSRAMAAYRLRFEANLVKDLLVSSISHEIGSPLASIVGSAETLSKMPEMQKDSRISTLLDVLHQESSRLKQYAERISRATKINAGRDALHPSYVDLNDVVNSVVMQRRSRMADYSVQLTLASDLPLIFVDEILIDLAISELIENAAKYSPTGSIISVSTFFDHGFTGVSVLDQGMGLSSSELKRLFNAPFRSSRHGESSFGMGIGLWIANSFVSSSGGIMTATSEGTGKGARFDIRFRAERAVVRSDD